MQITKTNGQFQVLQDDGTLVTPTGAGNDQKTLASMYTGSGAADSSPPPVNPAPTGGTPPPPPGSNPPAAPGTSLDPLSQMNFSIKSMLLDAQQGQMGINQNQQAGQAAINTAQATSDMGSTLNTGQSVAGLSPSQQDTARGAESKVFDVAGTNFKDKISYFSKNLNDIQSLLAQFGDIAALQIKATATPQAIEGYRQAIRSGAPLTIIPDAIRTQIMAQMTPDDLQQWAVENKKGVLGGNAQLPVYDDQGTIIGYSSQTSTLDQQKLGIEELRAQIAEARAAAAEANTNLPLQYIPSTVQADKRDSPWGSYIDISQYHGKETEIAKGVSASQGIVALSNQDSAAVDNLMATKGNLSAMQQFLQGNLPKDFFGRPLQQVKVKVSQMLQTSSDLAAFNSYALSAIQVIRTLGDRGRIPATLISEAQRALPNTTDTLDVANKKVDILNGILDRAGQSIVGNRPGLQQPSQSSGNTVTKGGGTFKKNPDGSYTRIK